MSCETFFTRTTSIAKVIEDLVQQTENSVDAALYRFSHPRLARALLGAAERGVKVRLVLDREKFNSTKATREFLEDGRILFRLLDGHLGPQSKMHHKLAVLDRRVALTGSYNWSRESDEENYEGLTVLREPEIVKAFIEEFDALWKEAEKP